jgi:tetratricopeptide (TPR) repeat protein
MGEIRAFVGHSFAKEDGATVTSFLDYFRTLAKSHLNFSWVNAAWAEPVELTAKVLRLMSDNDTFIGICTKQQASVSPKELKRTYLPAGFLKARAEKFHWKASDWMIQEIGLAVGKGLRIILLVENGLERPGALQGNIEYIDFDRTNPDASFPKILQMLIALSPRSLAQAAPLVAKPPEGEERTTPTEKSGDDDWWKPNADWTPVSYDIVAIELTRSGEYAKLDQLNEEYKKSRFSSDDDNAARWDAFIAYNQLVFGRNGIIVRLKKIAAENPESARVQELLGRGFAHLGEEAEAARAFEAAAAKATTSQIKVRLLGESAQAFFKGRHEEETARLIAEMRDQVEASPETEQQLLQALVKLAKNKDDEKGKIALLERIVELSPDYYDARFELAFAHSASGNEVLALFHYLKIPEHEREGAAWNNLGVANDQNDLPVHAVEAYRKAESENHTLAMSNLGLRFLKAGFLAEAIAECEKALTFDDPDKNVGLAWTQAKSASDEEQKRLDKILAEAGPVSDFYRQFGHAVTRQQSSLAGNWKAPDCVVTTTVEGNVFTSEGTYDTLGLASLIPALAGPYGGVAPARSLKYRISFSGLVNGRTVRGTVDRRLADDGSPKPTIVGGAKGLPEVFMTLSDDGAELKVMEISSSAPVRFYSLIATRQASGIHTAGAQQASAS